MYLLMHTGTLHGAKCDIDNKRYTQYSITVTYLYMCDVTIWLHLAFVIALKIHLCNSKPIIAIYRNNALLFL